MKQLFSPIKIKNLDLKNRVVMPPMCQYSVTAEDGTPNDWHFAHYVSRAVGGTSLIIVEMTNVEPDGRISNNCLGLWSDAQIPAYKRIVDGVHAQGAKIAIQIAHAGRKAEDAEKPVAPSAIRFSEKYKEPRALSAAEVKDMVDKYKQAARRAVEAGFDSIELHGAHGYLIHQFHSRYTNKREDEYGELTRFGTEVIQAVKSEMPADMPLILRISATEFVEEGYTLEGGIEIAKVYKEAGVDIFDISAGGEGAIAPSRNPGSHAGYMLPFARAMREALDVPVMAVGNLETPRLADAVIGNQDADFVAVGRGMLRDPYWTIHAAHELGQDIKVPVQYERGFA
ncbi:NADH:flavin oxidoreductase/NADH oxidase [Gracilibacillus caseinilyticus]|uniref:NADH:flavin oxidoreductase/NADH oxidase n=1 Tax=Gracilibacillus caseinilyticus TaxID=2932256 RepID=A0ABY4EW95_9BACI|nr:NADH:flavin oxidoreductase/NADH oxidase [Gracilibacillus caseinilyticus]UOQ48540.1 NADH:flavin oxidoreductase/NADH oxidase [Gracilibacillus caseinilyticus]